MRDVQQIVRRDFNPRTSCEVRPTALNFLGRDTVISIHAPHARCDFVLNSPQPSQQISIHAPHARCDRSTCLICSYISDFNPRTSCEVRHNTGQPQDNTDIFQSTHLMRGATLQPSLPCLTVSYFNPRTSCEVRLYNLLYLV